MARRFPVSAERETSAQTGRPMKSGGLGCFWLLVMKIPERTSVRHSRATVKSPDERRARERQQGKCNYEATRRTMETWRSYTTPCPVNRYGGPTTEGSAKGRTGVAKETRCVQKAHKSA